MEKKMKQQEFPFVARKKNDYDKLGIIQQACKKSGLSFKLNYSEVDDSWYFVITNIGEQGFVGKSRHAFEFAVSDALNWIRDNGGVIGEPCGE
jgi:hypothetical protein